MLTLSPVEGTFAGTIIAPLYPSVVYPEHSAFNVRVLYGPRCPHQLALHVVGQLLLTGQEVLVLDGANSFDAYLLSRMAQATGQRPEHVLSRLMISRAFTCHQMAELVMTKLAPAVKKRRYNFVLCAGLLATFYDEDVPLVEAKRLLGKVLAKIGELA
jgi:hypothetical protein